MTGKPRIVYVDDEPRNLSLFQVVLGDEFELKLYESAVEALKELKQVDPWVIVSDQRMPIMTGLEFLEVAAQLVPNTPRVIITGQTDEETMLKLVRRARLYDYITKPVMEDDLITSIKKAVEFSQHQRDMARMIAEKDALNKELLEKTATLQKRNEQLEAAQRSEIELRQEAEAWASIEIVHAIQEQKLTFPIKRDLTCITYDIVQSSALHGKTIDGQDIRGEILNLFTSALLRFGGIQECHGGDAAFGHFGAFSGAENATAHALAVAQDFRLALRNLTRIHNVQVECGIAIHYAANAIVNVHEVRAESSRGKVVKKFLSSAAPSIDQMFRLEKLTHHLPGTNIILTEALVAKLPAHTKVQLLGTPKSANGLRQVRAFIIASDLVNAETMQKFIETYFHPQALDEGQKAA
jgi:FixJ family two-component response regulator